MRTLGVEEPGHDIDLSVVDRLESVRQRVRQRLLLWRGTWFADVQAGVPYIEDVFGRQQDAGLAQRTITDILRTVEDVTDVREVLAALDETTRRFRYQAVLDTPFGALEVDEELGGS